MLAEHVLPELNERADLASLRPPYFLSAGCARGEEAYSLAILVSRFPFFTREMIRPPVVATDIDLSSLETARAGRYGSRALAGVPVDLKNGFFEKNGNLYSVTDGIKNLISYMRHDILLDPLPGRFLLVLCRNLLIYLEKEAQEKLIHRLTDSLYPGGYLVLGKSEVLVGGTRGRFKPVFPGERIYQKVDNDHGPPEPLRRRGG
jgi:chemotaxis protein methyltransferase CheR